MNVLNLLSEEINDKDWNVEEKARYLYLRSCQLFSYDPRYKFFGLFKDWQIMENNIRYREIDLENVKDNLVICTSHAEKVYAELLRKLIDIKPTERGHGHVWVEFYDGNRKIMADATELSDLARVKMQLETRGYRPETREYGYNNKLKEIDRKIGYIISEYENNSLKIEKNRITEKFKNNQFDINSLDDFIIYNLYSIKEIFERYTEFSSFSDAEFCISYLLRNFLGQYVKTNNKIISTIPLFQIQDNGNWIFINIYSIRLKDDTLYFVLEQRNNEFCFYEIPELEALHYMKTLSGSNKEAIYTNKRYMWK